MSLELDTSATEVDGGWRDDDGFVISLQQGEGPRANPRGEFPTGPDVGSPMPDVKSLDSFGKPFDLHAARAGRPAIFVFQRSAVW